MVKYGRKMPPTSLQLLLRDLEEYASKFIPPLKVRLEKEEVDEGFYGCYEDYVREDEAHKRRADL